MKIVLLIIIVNFLIGDDEKKIPKLDLRDGNLTIDINVKDVFTEPIDGGRTLIPAQIDEIKNIAKNYNVSPLTKDDVVVFETSLGTMRFNLFMEDAPNHCLNFKKLSNSGFYDETLIFRVVPNFIIQAGDLLTRDSIIGNDGTGNPGWTINAELNNKKHKKGILSMARGSDLNSAGSQFFICVGEASHLDGKYTIFGEISMEDNSNEVLDRIVKIPSESKKILSLSRNSIPVDAIEDEWLEYVFNDNKLFFKIPESETEDSFRKYIENKIDNIYKPSIPIVIKKISVVDKNSIKEEVPFDYNVINKLKSKNNEKNK